MVLPTILSWNEFQDYPQRCKPASSYDATHESKVPHPWWDLDKDAIQAGLKDISERVQSATKGATDLDKEIQHLVTTATKLEQVKKTQAVRVAHMGPQGAGKSLLNCALFDCPDISLTGAKGSACTSTIVKYAYSPSDKFAAQVRFLNATKTECMIDEHIRSYMDYHNDLDNSDDEGGPHKRSLNQDEIDRKRNNTAEDFFRIIFGSRDVFLTAWSKGDLNEFKWVCEVKCKEAMKLHDINSEGVATFSEDTPKELLDVIRPFLTDVDNEVCLWPIVDCVTIRLNHPLLEQNLEIIDLPGKFLAPREYGGF